MRFLYKPDTYRTLSIIALFLSRFKVPWTATSKELSLAVMILLEDKEGAMFERECWSPVIWPEDLESTYQSWYDGPTLVKFSSVDNFEGGRDVPKLSKEKSEAT